eukprot:CAMPEP_0169121312 /NCGR_PEP_ID=MMETSP1015-20121227/32599_1 /TAXON_ID=342587 /ORGANISM="Karlodinium micrum, Strain CCMP2283" /LENGTH=96 /DNA_ID=CAMNT_0009184403 /DNA_START=290 /DNA_END=580 /DNA_ORIENTATION=+
MNASNMAFKKKTTARQSNQAMSMPSLIAYQPTTTVRATKKPPIMSKDRNRAAATLIKSVRTTTSQGLILNAKDVGGPAVAASTRPGDNTISQLLSA